MKSYKKYIPVADRPLTNREYEVLRLLITGKTNTEIAKDLKVTTHTAKAHVSTIFRKMNARDRLQAAVIALKDGWIASGN